MNTVPENWIPFIPVHVPDNNRQIQLQRAAMPRVLPGAAHRGKSPTADDASAGRPRRSDWSRPYFIHEEEVPRAGARLTQYLLANAMDLGTRIHLVPRAEANRPR